MRLRRPVLLAAQLGIAVVCVLGTASPAAAHKASVFAAVQGKVISGEAYFRDGSPLRNAQVTVFEPAGTKLGETKTDAEGKFSFEPRRRCDHRLVVDGGEGHAAEYTVRAEELPSGLPDGNAAVQSGPVPPPSTPQAQPPSRAQVAQQPSAVPDSPARLAATAPQAAPGIADLHGKLEALEKQIVQLRRDLAARDDSTRFRDVLGGIGYILGLMGLAFYFLGTRRKAESSPSPPAGG